MKWFLCHRYLPDARGNVDPPDHVGPFASKEAALAHRGVYGPMAADPIELDESPPSLHVISSAEHARTATERH